MMTFHLTFRHFTGINIINLYNAIRFREHKIVTSCDISTVLPRSTSLPHPIGIVIGHDAEVGENVCIRHHVTLGRSVPEQSAGYPTVNDGVVIGTGTTVLGDITIGENASIGANSVVLDDVPPGSTVVGSPATEVD
ncbi:serine O-acetyltransferase [Halorubrum distributum]|nr:serine acetyltransferase [Halorubrum terrestre]